MIKNEFSLEITEILRDIMTEKQLTVSQFAKAIGVKPSQISEWLRGKAKPGYDNLRNICIHLDISGDDILGLNN
ncbi:MAG: helix-turn-helix transcriptional regulator [Clostridia bacterium]|nr:helix-turn-helix transcriptional regulator [Clostridia bacterium]